MAILRSPDEVRARVAAFLQRVQDDPMDEALPSEQENIYLDALETIAAGVPGSYDFAAEALKARVAVYDRFRFVINGA